jgi:hypothetical protein
VSRAHALGPASPRAPPASAAARRRSGAASALRALGVSVDAATGEDSHHIRQLLAERLFDFVDVS